MDGQSTESGVTNMNAEALKNLMREAIRDELTACGLLASTPAERIEAQTDFQFLRRARKAYDGAVTKVGGAVLLLLVGFVASLITLGFNFKFGK